MMPSCGGGGGGVATLNTRPPWTSVNETRSCFTPSSKTSKSSFLRSETNRPALSRAMTSIVMTSTRVVKSGLVCWSSTARLTAGLPRLTGWRAARGGGAVWRGGGGGVAGFCCAHVCIPAIATSNALIDNTRSKEELLRAIALIIVPQIWVLRRRRDDLDVRIVVVVFRPSRSGRCHPARRRPPAMVRRPAGTRRSARHASAARHGGGDVSGAAAPQGSAAAAGAAGDGKFIPRESGARNFGALEFRPLDSRPIFRRFVVRPVQAARPPPARAHRYRRRPDDTTNVRSSTGSISSGPLGISDKPTRRASVSRPSSRTGSSYGWIGRSTVSTTSVSGSRTSASRNGRSAVSSSVARVGRVMRRAAFLFRLIAKSGRVRRPLPRRHLRTRSRRYASRSLLRPSALTARTATARPGRRGTAFAAAAGRAAPPRFRASSARAAWRAPAGACAAERPNRR